MLHCTENESVEMQRSFKTSYPIDHPSFLSHIKKWSSLMLLNRQECVSIYSGSRHNQMVNSFSSTSSHMPQTVPNLTYIKQHLDTGLFIATNIYQLLLHWGCLYFYTSPQSNTWSSLPVNVASYFCLLGTTSGRTSGLFSFCEIKTVFLKLLNVIMLLICSYLMCFKKI